MQRIASRRAGASDVLRHLALALMGAVLTTVGVGGGVAPANAHSELLSSDPPAGAQLMSPPERLTLTFATDLQAEFVSAQLRVGGGEGQTLTAQVEGAALVVQVPPPSPEPADSDAPVAWTVAYRVAATDGHSISGELVFSVSAGLASPVRDRDGQSAGPPQGAFAQPLPPPQADDRQLMPSTVDRYSGDASVPGPSAGERTRTSFPGQSVVLLGVLTIAMLSAVAMTAGARRRAG